jgi:hypothetical protein
MTSCRTMALMWVPAHGLMADCIVQRHSMQMLLEVWAGDPPHEAPGWYDLYDTDEAMNIVQRQQQDVAEFLSKGY